LGPGELPALRVGDADVFRIVLSMMAAPAPDAAGRSSDSSSKPAGVVELALGALRAVENVSCTSHREETFMHALIERYADTLLSVAGCRYLDPQVLARCTYLESLSDPSRYPSAVWLGLSQLHTLLDVDLGKVSVASIATALPRLHTLTTSRDVYGVVGHRAPSVAGFFEDLLPRLRVFRFTGRWPAEADSSSSNAAALPPPLPLLRELAWHAYEPVATATLRGFLRAQPTLLLVPADFLDIERPHMVDGAALEDPLSGLLARVCELHIRSSTDATRPPLVPADVARVLRAAPQLRTLRIDHRVRGDTIMPWLAAPDAAAVVSAEAPETDAAAAAFEGLTHRRLRRFSLQLAAAGAAVVSCPAPDAECAARLRRLHFPRLRELTVGDKPYFTD
jgi:hypothetical protein